MHPDTRSTGRRVPAALILILFLAGAAAWVFLAATGAGSDADITAADVEGDDPRFGGELALPADSMLGFVEVPAGPFLMGSDPALDPGAFDNEYWRAGGGQGTVELPSFYIGRYEVTVGQFAAFLRATDRQMADPTPLRARSNYPITGVSWPDALAYARWLDERLRNDPATPATLRQKLASGWSVTLPTEAQWEKAARGPDGRIFPWGNEPRREFANFGSVGPQPVGSRPCADCAYGLADMSGNVWEWTRSPYQPLPYDPSNRHTDLAADALWVMRGGGFSDGAQLVRAATRGGADPGARRPFIGFRVVISPE